MVSPEQAPLDKTKGLAAYRICELLPNLGKDRPFLSPGTSISANRPIDGANADHQTKGPELDGLLGIVLEQFKPSFYGKRPAPKHLVVLGDDLKLRQTNYNRPLIRKEKPLPLYNHYAGGSGWWDNDMEGIDNEAEGSSEVWEGMRSATICGLDWH
ncbi:hypothetical protein Tco_0246380 [Tanacetum coccineum]